MKVRITNIFSISTALAATATTFLALPTASLSQNTFVPTAVAVSDEPNHRIRFDNGKVRMYEVRLAQGSSSAFHRHATNNFQVFFNTASVSVDNIVAKEEPQRSVLSVKAGQVAFSSTEKGPYTHRIAAAGDVPFHVIAMEILGKTSGSADLAQRRPQPTFTVVQENALGRAYRFRLKPGESTAVFVRPTNTAVFAISGGRISEIAQDGTQRLWDSEVGNFRWADQREILSLRNENDTDVEFVEIEVF